MRIGRDHANAPWLERSGHIDAGNPIRKMAEHTPKVRLANDADLAIALGDACLTCPARTSSGSQTIAMFTPNSSHSNVISNEK
jgi:hypothetical protein